MEEYEWKLLETTDGLIDNYLPLLEPFKNQIIWSKSQNHYSLPRPQKGLDAKIDELCTKIDSLKEELQSLLKELKEQTKSKQISFAHNRKYRY